MAWRTALVVGLLAGCAAFSPQRLAVPIAESLRSSSTSTLRRAAVLVAADSDVSPAKITIRAPSDAADEATGAKVTVRVRAPSKDGAAAQAAAAAPVALDDDMDTKVTIKAPAVETKVKIEALPLTDAEKDLLDATQRANCTLILAALQAGANPNVRDPKGRTPLHFVAGVGLAPAAMLLIHFGAQIDVRESDGLTPMHMAAGYANAQTLRVLVAAGADTNVTANQQGTPFEVVVALGDYQLKQVYEKKSINRFKKKDEKLEQLKACLEVLDDPEAVRAEADWDEMITEVLKAVLPVEPVPQ